MPFAKLTKNEIREIKKHGTGYRENHVLDNKGLVVKRKGNSKDSLILDIYKKGVNPKKSYDQNDSVSILKSKRKDGKYRYSIVG